MKKNIFHILFLIIIISSCKKDIIIRELYIDNSLFKIISIDPNEFDKNNLAKISEITDEIEYIPLQTSNNFLIGDITKMIVWNDIFYIWDRISEAVFCFDKDGNFINKILKKGFGPEEYPRISDFTINKENGNIYIYSDEGEGIYEYTIEGSFIKKNRTQGILISSFALLQDNIFLCYGGKLPNNHLYKSIQPEQCRFFVKSTDSIYQHQLKFRFDNDYWRLPLSTNNFSFYNDTILLTEFFNPEIYSVDLDGKLIPRYRINFLSNTYNPSFEQALDLKRIESEKGLGNLATLWNAFFETDKYIFINYAWALVGFAYVKKENNTIHNLGFFIDDDINKITLSPSFLFVDNNHLYQVKEPLTFLENQKKRLNTSSYLQNITKKLCEDDNPVIVKIKLK